MGMDDSTVHPGSALRAWELSGWKTFLAAASAVAMSALFLVAGVWKITDTPGAAMRLTQALVPEELSVPAALALGITETFAGVLILVPRYRRWGAWLISAMLVAFMIYVGWHYQALRGEECNCFPWIKRAVGPGFFVADAVMLALAAVAAWWSKPSHGLRNAAVILGVVVVFALASYGVAVTQPRGAPAPARIMVDGQPFSLREGKVFLYFFDPECSHCLQAGRKMAKLDWGQTRVVVVPTVQPQFAAGFLEATGMRAGVSHDVEALQKAFAVPSTPVAVAVEDGRQRMLVTQFDGEEPAATLRRIGFAEAKTP